MSLRRRTNRHDARIKHREESAGKIAEIVLAFRIVRERADVGGVSDDRLSADLEALPEPQFWKLFYFATSWFDYDAAIFTASKGVGSVVVAVRPLDNHPPQRTGAAGKLVVTRESHGRGPGH